MKKPIKKVKFDFSKLSLSDRHKLYQLIVKAGKKKK
jgi:hypothetical protein